MMAKYDRPPKPEKGTYELCGRQFPRKTWYKNKNMAVLYFYIVILWLSNTANGFDGSMMNGLQVLHYWSDYFGHPHGSLLGLFSSIFSVGSVVALVFFPYVSDRWGRKQGMVSGAVIMLIGIALQTAAKNFQMFVAARFIIGFGDSIVIACAPLLISEIAPAQDRAILVSGFSIFYFTGAVIAAWSTYGTLTIESDWAWRAPSLLQCTFSIIQLAVIWWIPESPRYLINRDKPEQALEILAKYHADGDTNDEAVRLEYTEICNAIALDKSVGIKYSYLDFLKTSGNRKRLIIIVSIGVFSQWSGNGLIGYYINIILNNIGVTNSKTQLLINGGLTLWSFFWNIIFCFFIDRWGRRPIYIWSTLGMLITFVIWTILSARYSMTKASGCGTGVIVLIFVYNWFYAVKSGLLTAYTTEILPYGLRAKGITILYFSVDVALFFNQYVNPIAMDNIAWKYYIFYCVFLAFEVVVLYFFIVETRYTPLEEVAKYFDGEDVGEVITNVGKELKEPTGAAREIEMA